MLGKATIVNTLILSKCWYIFRVTPLTQQDLQQIISVAIQFLRKGIFPVIPWSTWILPRDAGGLGVIDVKKQYSALYFRWIQPLLLTDFASNSVNPLDILLIHHINNHNGSQLHQLPLLLPNSRRQLPRNRRVSTIDIIYKSIDMLPRNYDLVSLNVATSLLLPLSTVLFKASDREFRIPKKISNMIVSDVFQLHPNGQFLHWKDPSDLSLTLWKQAPKQLYKGLESGDLQLQPFFLPLCDPNSEVASPLTSITLRPFSDKLILPNAITVSSARITSKIFRQACSSLSVAPAYLTSIPSSAWSFFWSLSLTMIQRNVFYRFLNNCIPHRSLLHRIFPTVHLSPLCAVCSSVEDSVDHFLFRCPSKAAVWQGIIFEFLWPTVTIDDIRHAILTFDFYNIRYSQQPLAPSYIIVIITLANIWKAHFRFIFNQQPFVTASILNHIRLDILQRIDEDQIHSRL